MIWVAILASLPGLALAVLALKHIDHCEDEIEILTKRLRLLEEDAWNREDGEVLLFEEAMRRKINEARASRN